VIAIEVVDLSKSYPLKDTPWGRFRHVFAPGEVRYEQGLWALRGVTFKVEKGEAFGVVGANGSGKSTLLQIAAGILRPTSGSVEVHGRLSALLELGSGFAPEFTGRQNVFLNASILGFSRAEIAERFETIERFAGIGDFIDQPIRTYSTGMVLRLAFAVAAHVDPEILIVDEALAVGDIAFRQRCMRRIHELRAGGTTILFVSHDTGDVKALCERCLWLDHGCVRALGEADDVVAGYLSAMIGRERLRDSERTGRGARLPIKGDDSAVAARSVSVVHEVSTERRVNRVGAPPPEVVCPVNGSYRYGSGNAMLTGVELVTPGGDPVRRWMPRASVVLRVSFHVRKQLFSPIAGFLIRNRKGETIFGSNTARENYPLPLMAAGDIHTVDFHWIMPELAAGAYFVSIAISEGTLDRFEVCDYVEDAVAIAAEPDGGARGYMHLRCADVSVYRS
jgi:lipopolysaccharide transport system ATP-binding protein